MPHFQSGLSAGQDSLCAILWIHALFSALEKPPETMPHCRDACLCPSSPKIISPLRLGPDLGLAVGHLNAELLRPGDDVDALAGRDGVGDSADN